MKFLLVNEDAHLAVLAPFHGKLCSCIDYSKMLPSTLSCYVSDVVHIELLDNVADMETMPFFLTTVT